MAHCPPAIIVISCSSPSMAKTDSPVLATPGMSLKQKPAPPKSGGKQTSLLGFFTKVLPSVTMAVPASKGKECIETHPPVLLTPTPSSDFGRDASPVGVSPDKPAQPTGLRMPETPVVDKQWEVGPLQMDSGSRRVSGLYLCRLD